MLILYHSWAPWIIIYIPVLLGDEGAATGAVSPSPPDGFFIAVAFVPGDGYVSKVAWDGRLAAAEANSNCWKKNKEHDKLKKATQNRAHLPRECKNYKSYKSYHLTQHDLSSRSKNDTAVALKKYFPLFYLDLAKSPEIPFHIPCFPKAAKLCLSSTPFLAARLGDQTSQQRSWKLLQSKCAAARVFLPHFILFFLNKKITK